MTYSEEKLSEIFKNHDNSHELNSALAASWLCANKKAVNLKILHVAPLTTLSEYFVLASTSNDTQAQSIANDLMRSLKGFDNKCGSYEGQESGEWMLLDFGHMIVHLFHEPMRNIFDLESIYESAQEIEIPESFYFQSPSTQSNKKSFKDFI